MAAAEGLFALELLVEAVRVATAGPARRPAVALRLLDFPTLLLLPAAPGPPLRPGRAVPFGRGKRCLFRWRRDSLCAALQRRPLRASLLALPAGLAPGPPRLLGRCDVSLAPVAAELLRQRPGAPASCGRRGRFPVRDAAGRPVGELALGYRLSSLEAAEEPPPPEPGSPQAATPPAASLHPESEEEEEGEEEEGEELDANIFCPPMLYYSREAAEPCVPPAAAGRWQRVEVRRPQDKDTDRSPPRPSAGPSLLHPANPPELHNSLGQLPLLSALLAELSVLAQSAAPAAVHPHLAWLCQPPGGGGAASQAPSPSALKPAEAPVGPSGGSSGAASPRFKQGRQGAGRGPEKAVPRGETGSESYCTTKENRPPRKKLLYGLTNTLRLRLQQNNPDNLIILEKREQYRKKQMEIVKERSPLTRRKPLRGAGEQRVASHRHCSKGNSSKQSNQFNKTVEVSLQKGSVREHTSMAQGVSPGRQKRAAASLLSAATASKEHLCKITPAPLLEESGLKSAQEEKHPKAQLPEAFPAAADAEGSNEEAMHLIHHQTTEHDNVSVVSDHQPSPSRSVENNCEFIYSDDFVSSSENTACSEDFSSAVCMGRDLEPPDTSPEPLQLESPKPGWSDREVESSTSRISKASQRAESTSDLRPVPSASSPVLSLRRIRDLQSSQRTSGESAGSLSAARVEASLGEEQEAQCTSKEEDRDDQPSKHFPTLRSNHLSSDTDLNIGKGQSSAGKSHSVTRVTSYLPSDTSDLELGVLESSVSDKENDSLGKLCTPNQYRDMSELVINKLPGYTM